MTPPTTELFRRWPKSRGAGFFVAVTLVVFMLKSVIVLHGGLEYGRLSLPPVYDDVSYFIDGMLRRTVLLEHGLVAVVRDLVANPPHAHYSTIAAGIGFLFGGPTMVAPYVMNGIAMALMAAALFRIFRLSAVTSWSAALVLVTTAWFDHTVTVFHPDLIAGFGAAIIVAILVWQDEVIGKRSHAVLVGVMAALVLFIKPVAFPMIVGLWGVALLAGAAIAWREGQSLRRTGARLLPGAVFFLVIAGPYFTGKLLPIIGYIRRGFVEEQDTWSLGLSPLEHGLYYIDYAASYLRPWILVAAIGVIGVMAAAIVRRDRTTALRFGGLLLTTFAAYLVPTCLEVKSPYFGGIFYGCIAVGLVLVLHFVLDRLFVPGSFGHSRARRFDLRDARLVRWGLILIFGVTVFARFRDRQLRFTHMPIPVAGLEREYKDVYRLMKEVHRATFGPQPQLSERLSVFFPVPAPVSPHGYEFRGLVDGLGFEVGYAPHDTELQVLIDHANRSAFVAVPDEDVIELVHPYPVVDLLPAFREWLAADARLVPIGTVDNGVGRVEVFADVERGDIVPRRSGTE